MVWCIFHQKITLLYVPCSQLVPIPQSKESWKVIHQKVQSQHLSSNSITCVHESDEKGRESFFKESSKELTFILEFFAKVEIYSITLEISLETCQIKRIFWG